MNWLPTPLGFSLIGAALIAGGAAILIFVPLMKSFGFLFGAAGAVCFMLGGIEYHGEQLVQAKFDAFKAAAAKQAADTAAAQNAAVQKAELDAQAAAKTQKEHEDALNQEVEGLKHSVVVVSGALARVVRDSSGPAKGNPAAKSSGSGTAPAVPASADADSVPAQCYDEQDVGKYFAAARAAYDGAVLGWQTCRNEYNGVRAPTLKGN